MKSEEIIPEVIKRLSKGDSLSTKEITKEYGVVPSSFNDKFKPVRDEFYEHFIEQDKSSNKWTRQEPLFLEKMLLTPEETVVLSGILRKKKAFGDKLAPWVEKIVDNYIKRTKMSVFKQDILEKIDDDLEIIFARLKYAIEEKRKIRFTNKERSITLYPYKIINLEYYWYILGYEEYSEYWMEVEKKPEKSKRVKTFTIVKIRNLEVLDETYQYDFSRTNEELKHAMNAFFSVDEYSETIELLVVYWLEDYITRAPYFSGWHKTQEEVLIKDEGADKEVKYFVYEIKSSNKYYADIIPTILKYIPNIRVRSDEKLVEKIFENIAIFAKAHNKEIKESNI